MRFAFAGIDFLGEVFDELIRQGWQPVRLFTRPCDGIYDFNDEVVARAREAEAVRPDAVLVVDDLRVGAVPADRGRGVHGEAAVG